MQDLDEKTSLIISLIKMAQVDGRVNHYEQMNISMLTNTLGVDHAKVMLLKKNLDNVPVVAPESEKDKVKYYWRMLIMMKMDLEAHEKEIELGKDLGVALGLPLNEVVGLMDYMVENVNKFIGLEKFEAQLFVVRNDPNYQPKLSLFQRLLNQFK
tara:strand:- start:454 stop:918 length:465 start_codon:yes stop_codon:yes gene_type:complete